MTDYQMFKCKKYRLHKYQFTSIDLNFDILNSKFKT